VPGEARIGAIVSVGREPSARSVDKTIAAYAARNDGFYEPRAHAEIAGMSGRIPGGDVEAHIEAHIRRLEALRRAGIVARLDGDHWVIPPDFLQRAAGDLLLEGHGRVYLDARLAPLALVVGAEAATWLDRQLVGRHRVQRLRWQGRDGSVAA
jgi:hypothetical protein